MVVRLVRVTDLRIFVFPADQQIQGSAERRHADKGQHQRGWQVCHFGLGRWTGDIAGVNGVTPHRIWRC